MSQVENSEKTVSPELKSYYKFSKVILILDLISIILAFIGAFLLLAVPVSAEFAMVALIAFILLALFGIAAAILMLVWVIKTLVLKLDNQDLRTQAIIWGLLGLFLLGWIAVLVFMIQIKKAYPNINN
ncbi:MAG: hypothetical protein ACRCVI_01385 [Mycoplasmoidaceae bacterium]